MKGDRVTLAGAIMNVRRVTTKKQETMAIAQLEDLHGAITAVVFPRTYAANPEIWREDNVVLVSGKVEVRRVESAGKEEDLRGVPELLIDSASEWNSEDFPVPEADGEDWPPTFEPDPTSFDSMGTESIIGAALGEETAVPGLTPDGSLVVREPAAGYDLATTSTDATDTTDHHPPGIDGEMGPEPSPDNGIEDDRRGHPTLEQAFTPVAPIFNPPAANSESAGTKVTFVFRESGDQASDLDRLRRLHTTLSQWRGEDPFMISFDGAHGRRQLVGEQLRISFCQQLQSEVEEILGQGSVLIPASVASGLG